MVFGFAQAQPENFKLMSASDQATAAANITKTSNALKSLQCRFVQERVSSVLAETEKSSGTMLYKAPNKLRWEYVQPKPLVFILNGTKVIFTADGKTKDVNVGASKTMKSMIDMILGMITGKELQNATNFTCTYYSSGRQILVRLTPVTKALKKVFSSVDIYFNSQIFFAEKIVMRESSGDSTTLKFFEVKSDQIIDDKKFE